MVEKFLVFYELSPRHFAGVWQWMIVLQNWKMTTEQEILIIIEECQEL